jgi:NADPH2:quinone reductase
MKAFRLTDYSTPPILADIDRLEPGPDEVQVQIAACGLNFADLLMCKGQYQEKPPLPMTLGMELSGTVTDRGGRVQTVSIGDRVALFPGQGGLAEFGCFPAAMCTSLPDTMSFEDAAAFQVAYGTSHLALDHKARLQPGETLLVLGAAGGVGLTAVEIGKLMGARVIAVARGADKLAVAKDAGADHLIDSDAGSLRDAVRDLGGADVVYDPVGGDLFTDAMRATNPDGRILAVGFASGTVPQIPANHLLVKNISVQGLYWGGYANFAPEVLTQSMAKLFAWYSDDKLRPHIGQTFPLDRASEGLEMLRARKTTGKVVITMSGD